VTRDDDALRDDSTWPTDDEAVTADEQIEGRSLDARLDEETPDDEAAPSEGDTRELVDEDRPDTEPELVSEITPPLERGLEGAEENTAGFATDTGWDRVDDTPPAEDAAVSVRDEVPGGTDDESDDYVADDEGAA
jgi:hypothetical protein